MAHGYPDVESEASFMPAIQPSPNIDNDQDIKYIDEPEPVPVREQLGAHFVEQVSVEETRAAMPDNDEMAILVNLKHSRLRQQARSGHSQEVGLSQGHNESDLDYDVRLTRLARAAVLAEIHAGMTTAELYRALAPHDGPMRVVESHTTCSFLSGSNTIPLLTQQRSGDRQEPGHIPITIEDSAGGDSNSRDKSPGVSCLDRWGMYLGPRASFSISNIMRRPSSSLAQPFTDRTLE